MCASRPRYDDRSVATRAVQASAQVDAPVYDVRVGNFRNRMNDGETSSVGHAAAYEPQTPGVYLCVEGQMPRVVAAQWCDGWHGWTPLMLAVLYDHEESVSALLAAGASLNVKAGSKKLVRGAATRAL